MVFITLSNSSIKQIHRILLKRSRLSPDITPVIVKLRDGNRRVRLWQKVEEEVDFAESGKNCYVCV